MENNDKQSVQDLSQEFALEIIHFHRFLNNNNDFWLSNQLVRCGTAIGAMISEAQNAESRKDFLHKIKIAAKEANEAKYWLTLCSKIYQFPQCECLITKLNRIIKILGKIISTTISKIKAERNNHP